MKKISSIILLLVLFCLTAQAKKDNGILKKSKGSITFVVDKDLPAPKQTLPAYDNQWVATQIIGALAIPQELHHVLKTSFDGERMNYQGDDNFFKCMVLAYTDHRPLVLSPDVVWLAISQGFSRYVNAHVEEMRDLLVSHQGKMDLLVMSNNDVLSDKADWELLLNDFSAAIAQHTKGELADLITADFTTTGITERIASQISLMDVVKEYFNYLNGVIACGIPSITLKGTPEDWEKVLDKVRGLKKYNLGRWPDDLEIILQEFVEASKGNPNQKFWQNIVKRRRVDHMKKSKACLPDPSGTTWLDGWFLKLFPNREGVTNDSVMWDTSMPKEMTRVGFKQVLIDPVTGETMMTIPLELWAGFVGIEEDEKTRALTPKIGWLARMSDEEAEEVGRLGERDKYMGGLSYYMCENCENKKVPEILSKLTHIRKLSLEFWNMPVDIPAWLDNIEIERLYISGVMTEEEEAQLRQRFPKANIKRTEQTNKTDLPIPIRVVNEPL